MELVGGEFVECVLKHRDVWLPARGIVQNAIEKRHEVCHKYVRMYTIGKLCHNTCSIGTRCFQQAYKHLHLASNDGQRNHKGVKTDCHVKLIGPV